VHVISLNFTFMLTT